jgi:hypothetical protein
MKSLFTYWRHTGDVEVWLHSFLSSALDGGDRSSPRPGCFASRKKHGNHWIGGWGWGHSLNVFEKRKSHAFLGIGTPDRLAPSLVTIKIAIMNLKGTFLLMSVSNLYCNCFLYLFFIYQQSVAALIPYPLPQPSITRKNFMNFSSSFKYVYRCLAFRDCYSFYSVYHFFKSVFFVRLH